MRRMGLSSENRSSISKALPRLDEAVSLAVTEAVRTVVDRWTGQQAPHDKRGSGQGSHAHQNNKKSQYTRILTLPKWRDIFHSIAGSRPPSPQGPESHG